VILQSYLIKNQGFKNFEKKKKKNKKKKKKKKDKKEKKKPEEGLMAAIINVFEFPPRD